MAGGSKPRRAGDYFERATRAALEADGWVVVRSAGSHGPADLVVLKAGYWPRLISCKVNGKITRLETLALVSTAKQAGANPVVAWRPRPGIVAFTRYALHEPGAALESLHVPRRVRPE